MHSLNPTPLPPVGRTKWTSGGLEVDQPSTVSVHFWTAFASVHCSLLRSTSLHFSAPPRPRQPISPVPSRYAMRQCDKEAIDLVNDPAATETIGSGLTIAPHLSAELLGGSLTTQKRHSWF